MTEQAIKDKTAIAGIGWTEFTRGNAATTTTLAARASLMAIQDAGLSVQDIDGVVSYFHEVPNTVPPIRLVENLGMKRCNFQIFADAGGSWTAAAIMSAAMLVHSGICKNVLVYRALARSREGRSGPRSHDAGGPDQFIAPFGSQHAAANFGQNATAHMARFGTTTLDFAHLAVTQRKHATLNEKAQMRKPITIEDHQSSRWIVYPYRLLDCCLQTEGAVALVVTSAERARDLPHPPVYIMAGIGGYAPTADLWETNGVHCAPLLFEGAGITPRDVDFAEIYDPFTFMCMAHIEDLGFVKKGDIGGWVREGRNGLDGELPVNTHGGLLSEGYIHGLNHVVEAVQQLRPEGVVDDLCHGPHTYDRSTCRQVRNPEIGLVCGERVGSAVLLRRG